MASLNIPVSDFQRAILGIPEDYDLFMGGGRGGGKTYALLLLAWRFCESHGPLARALVVRRTYGGLSDIEALTRQLFGQVYGAAARYNGNDGIWRLPNGSHLELGQQRGPEDGAKYQGRNFGWIGIDEAGQWTTPADLDTLRSCLRAVGGIQPRYCLAANPMGEGHHWLFKRFVHKRVPWVPYTEESSGRQFITAPSTFRDNPYISHDSYERQLLAATALDKERQKAWINGDWFTAGGAYFSLVIDEHRNLREPWPSLPESFTFRHARWNRWGVYIAMDWGSSAPCIVYLVARSPGYKGPDGRFYPRGSLVLLDELAIVDPDDANKGLQWEIGRVAQAIRAMCDRWGTKAAGTADDACFSTHGHGAGSIAKEFRDHGVTLRPANKGGRIAGWMKMAQMLADAGKPDRPGLYVSRLCSYWWQTVPTLGRDPKRPEDVITTGADHAADACRYAITFDQPEPRMIKIVGF